MEQFVLPRLTPSPHTSLLKTALMMNKKILLFVATMSLLGAADLCSARSARTRVNITPLVSRRIRQLERLDDNAARVAFLGPQSQQQQPQKKGSEQFTPFTPLTEWISDFTRAIQDDFAASTKDLNNEIFHECVVSYSKGLMGNF
jgi:hypothetical protein